MLAKKATTTTTTKTTTRRTSLTTAAPETADREIGVGAVVKQERLAFEKAYELCGACTEFGHFVSTLRSIGPLRLNGYRFDSSIVMADCCDNMPKKVLIALAAQGGVPVKRKWNKKDIVEAIVDEVERLSKSLE